MNNFEEKPMECETDKVSKILVVSDNIQQISDSLYKASARINAICDLLVGPQPEKEEKVPGEQKPDGQLHALESSLQTLRENESRIHGAIDRLEETRVC